MNQETNETVSRLPLWKACVEEMIASGVKPEDTYPVSYFAERLKCEPDAMEYSIAISEIRRVLEHRGLYLSGRGQKGEQFVVLSPEKNVGVMADYARKAADALRRGVILGTNTPMDTLTGEERKRHEKLLEKMAIKSVLIARPATVTRALAPKWRHRLALPRG